MVVVRGTSDVETQLGLARRCREMIEQAGDEQPRASKLERAYEDEHLVEQARGQAKPSESGED